MAMTELRQRSKCRHCYFVWLLQTNDSVGWVRVRAMIGLVYYIVCVRNYFLIPLSFKTILQACITGLLPPPEVEIVISFSSLNFL